MQSGRVVATLAFGGEEKLAVNIPATGVCTVVFFYVKVLLAQSPRQAMVWLQARSRTA